MTLPAGFEALEPFARDWAIEGSQARDDARTVRSADERQAFYDAMTPHLAEALDHLDQTPLAEHDAGQKALMLMTLSYAHVALAQEIQGPDEARHAASRRAIPITRAPADF
jgi:hypothetical protein